MDSVRLRFAGQGREDRPLAIGVHGLGRGAGGAVDLVEGGGEAVRLCVDRRGVWLNVDEGGPGVHVNGRQVRRMAMLRVGDAIYVDGVELRLVSTLPVEVPPADLSAPASGESPNLRVVLRGVGGRFHGRCFTLDRPRLVGRHPEADIRIDDPAFADRHARLELAGDQVVLRDLGSAEGSLVNGEAVRDALLAAGDQVVFDGHHRFVVEAPQRRAQGAGAAASAVVATPASAAPAAGPRGHVSRLPWLLLAAVGIAALLAALLLFGSG
ncbi:FHA domain-containing protein [Luteimonas kalidii]|uniref:FHA domain-containing protein n=1 Tax=Luteimonas kalidii TaxID=3042025 RepID=A0ABT6JT43_9GAMM|nr:FHA domain-containing protein [Luteimonas kalidii]MDH5833667.1 FHA domain-containing protein [Luteimonas kalidii]